MNKRPAAFKSTPRFILLILLLCSTVANGQQSELVYSTYIGGDGSEIRPRMTTGPDGSIYMTGVTGSENLFGDRVDLQIYVLKLNPQGQVDYVTILTEGGIPWGGIAVDADGNAYVAGSAIPDDVGADHVIAQGGLGEVSVDIFVMKLDPNGNRIFATLIHGNDNDEPHAIAVDADGFIYVGGGTSSDDLPTTAGAFQSSDPKTSVSGFTGFIAKLQPDGSALEYLTYLGGSSGAGVTDIALDDEAGVLMYGLTGSEDFPTVNAYQSTLAGGNDFFLARLLPDGSGLSFSTYFGGSGIDDDPIYGGFTRGPGGRLYLTGRTRSEDFPTLNALFDAPVEAGQNEAIAAGFDATGQLLFSTYLGAAGAELAEDIAVDAGGAIYLTGITTDPFGIIPSVDPLQEELLGFTDTYVMRLTPDAGAVTFASLLGGSERDDVTSIALVPGGRVVVAGQTSSEDFPTTDDAAQSVAGDRTNAFISIIELGSTEGVPVVSPAQIDFVNPTTGETAPIEISNIGGADLEIVNITVEPTSVFSLNNVPALPLVLSPGAQVELEVEYIEGGTQQKLADLDGELIVVANAEAPNDITAVPIDIKRLQLQTGPVRDAIRIGGDLTALKVSVTDTETGETATDIEGNAVYRLLEKSTQGIGQQLTATLSLIENGEAQDVFLETTRDLFDANTPITSQTVLAGTTYVEVTLEDVEAVEPDTVMVFLKSPFDFFIERVEVQQGIGRWDEAVELEYKPDESRTFAPLDFLAGHNTALRVFVGYETIAPIEFSIIESIEGLSADLTLFWNNQPLDLDFDPFALDEFTYRDPTLYGPQEEANLDDAILGLVSADQIDEPGTYRFEVTLSSEEGPDEMPEDKANNSCTTNDTCVTQDLVGTRPLRLLTRVAMISGESESSLPMVQESIWSFLKAAYPVQSSQVTYNDPNRVVQVYGGQVDFVKLSSVLNRHNAENPGDQRDKVVFFTNSADLIVRACLQPAGGCAPVGGKAVILFPNQLALAHELGHSLGLNDTYVDPNITTVSADPNPRRSEATEKGNLIEDGNILLRNDFITDGRFVQMRRGVNGPFYDFMGGDESNTWIDRVTWDYLYFTHFNASAPGKQLSTSDMDFITVTGTIGRNGSATFSPSLLMSTVPGLSVQNEDGSYAIEFRDEVDQILGDFRFDLRFHIPEVGDVDEMPFSFDLQLPSDTQSLVLLRADTVLARQMFSDQAPVVEFDAPVREVAAGDSLALSWTGTDADGDSLIYSLLYSPDGMEEAVLDVNLDRSSYTVHTGGIPVSPSARFTVIASDGINEGRDTVLVSIVSTSVKDSEIPPANSQLDQNYPNPFQSTTVIEYTLENQSHITLSVYDVLGRQIKNLVQGVQPAGKHQARFNADGLPNGLYYYQLTTDHKSLTRTMVLLR